MSKPASKKARTSAAAAPLPAAEVFQWHLVKQRDRAALEAEIDAGGTPFECEFYHQVFGEDEEIKGYTGLVVDVWVHEATYHAWLDVTYATKAPTADDIPGLLREWFPAGLISDRGAFVGTVLDAVGLLDFSAVGTRLSTTSLPPDGASSLTLQHLPIKDEPDWCKAVHARLEPLMVFTIDGASFLDKEDPHWEVVLAVKQEAEGQQTVVGVMTLYNFYAFPDGRRPRVAQILVVPPYQGQGVGRRLLAVAYQLAKDRDTLPLTFEDPSPSLQQLREKLELRMLMGCAWVEAAAQQAIASTTARAKADGGGSRSSSSSSSSSGSSSLRIPASCLERIVAELKIHPAQALLAWEALLWLQPELQQAGAAARLVDAFRGLLLERVVRQHGTPLNDLKQRKVGPVEVEEQSEGWFLYKPQTGSLGDGGAAGASGTVTVGRHNLAELDADEWSSKLSGLAEERMEQLKQLQAVMLQASKGAGKPYQG